jgi:hypothetical protein
MCAYFLLAVSDGKDCTESIEVDVGELKPCAISAQENRGNETEGKMPPSCN